MGYCSLLNKDEVKKKLRRSLSDQNIKVAPAAIESAAERISQIESVHERLTENSEAYIAINESVREVIQNGIQSLRSLAESGSIDPSKSQYILRTIKTLEQLANKYSQFDILVGDQIYAMNMIERMRAFIEAANSKYLQKKGYDKIGSVYTSTILTALNLMREQIASLSYLHRGKDITQFVRFLDSNISYYKREFIKNLIATNGNLVLSKNGEPYVRFNGNSFIHLDKAVDLLLNGLRNKDISIVSMLTTSLGNTFDGGTEATFESTLRNMLTRAEIEALHKSADIYNSLEYLLRTVKDDEWDFVIDSKRRVRTLYKEQFLIYRDRLTYEYMSEGKWKYSELINDSNKNYVKAVKTRDVLNYYMREEYNKVASNFYSYLKTIIEDYNVDGREELLNQIEKLVSDKLKIKEDEVAELDINNDVYHIAFRAEALRMLENIKEEYNAATFRFSSVLEDILSKREDRTLTEDEINELVNKLSDLIDGLTAVNKDYDGNRNTENDFILLPDIELARKSDKGWVRNMVDERFLEGFRRKGEAYGEVMGHMYNVMHSLWKVMPNSHYSSLASGDLFYISAEMADRSQGFVGRLFTTTSYMMEAYDNGIDIKSKYFSTRDLRGINTAYVEKHIRSALASAISKIYDYASSELKAKIKEDAASLDIEGMVKVLNSLSKEDIRMLARSGILQSLTNISEFSKNEIDMLISVGGLGDMLVSKAKDYAYRNASTNYPLLIANYAMAAAKFHSPLLNLNEINAIVLNFAAGERHAEKIKKIISTVYFGGDKKYNESKIGKALNLYLDEIKKDDPLIYTSKKNANEILKILDGFTKSEFFKQIKDSDEAKKFLEAINDVKSRRHLKGIAFVSTMNDIIRLISLTGNIKAVLLNIFHGVTSNFVLAAKYGISDNTITEYMDIIEKGMMLSVTNPNSAYAKKYLKIKMFMENYGIVGSFLDKSSLAAASEIVESLRKRGHSSLAEKMKGLAQPMWLYSRSEEYIQGSLAMAYLDENVELYEKTSVGYRKIKLLDAIDDNGFIRQDILNDPKNRDVARKIFDQMAKVKRLITEGHGQYGASNYTLLDGTSVGKMMLNFKKWMASYYYERFGEERYEIDFENGEAVIHKKEGRFKSLDLATAAAAAAMLSLSGAGLVVAMAPLGLGIKNFLNGKDVDMENVIALAAGAVSTLALPIDKALRFFGVKSNLSEVVADGIAGQIIAQDKSYKARNIFAIGKELGFLMLVFMMKEIAYLLSDSLSREDEEDDEIELRLLRTFHTISSNYMNDLFNAINQLSYAKSLILEPSIKWQFDNIRKIFTERNFQYKSGVWAGYDYHTKLISSLLPRSVVSTVVNPNYLFGFGTAGYYNYAAMETDLEHDKRTKRIHEWVKKRKKSIIGEWEDFLQEIFGIEPSIR